jgi:hypothetical protein
MALKKTLVVTVLSAVFLVVCAWLLGEKPEKPMPSDPVEVGSEKSEFRYDEVVRAKIGADGGTLRNADGSVVVTVPPLDREKEVVLSFKRSDFQARAGIASPVTVRLSPDAILPADATVPISIRVKYDPRYTLPVPYLIDGKGRLQLVDIESLDRNGHSLAMATFHGGDYSWIYADEK